MGSLLAEGNKKAKANQNISWLKKCVFTGFSLFEAHTLTIDARQKITNIQSTYRIFNTLILYFIQVVLWVFMKAAY
ncbi:hypothetical protein HpRN133_11620 [Helicobacter pylori]